jgi:hypothetical protein
MPVSYLSQKPQHAAQTPRRTRRNRTIRNFTIRRVHLAGKMADPDRVWMELACNLVAVTAMGRQASNIRSPMSSMEKVKPRLAVVVAKRRRR